ncbi:hypothetical protein [Umezawaea beigongshangensis]|uniref:hypothetical protein n=1 Tax=Umezawaea beigongshangensis TaxID=2780383 RepID=UPI0027DD3FEF|nr:hypothetical protein [Umezawaea beigongshangensis]
MDVTAVFQGLAEAVDTIPGLNCHPFLPDSISPPTFAPVDLEIAYNTTFGNRVEFNPVRCRLLLSRADDKSGQRKLQQYLAASGPKSVKAAIEADRTLGGTCDSLHVMTVTGYGWYEHAGTQYLGAQWDVRVIGKGD